MSTWRCPSYRVIEINCDASWCATKSIRGIRVIAQNHRGQVLGGLNQHLRGDDNTRWNSVDHRKRLDFIGDRVGCLERNKTST